MLELSSRKKRSERDKRESTNNDVRVKDIGRFQRVLSDHRVGISTIQRCLFKHHGVRVTLAFIRYIESMYTSEQRRDEIEKYTARRNRNACNAISLRKVDVNRVTRYYRSDLGALSNERTDSRFSRKESITRDTSIQISIASFVPLRAGPPLTNSRNRFLSLRFETLILF